MKKLHTDTKVFCAVTLAHWICSLLIYFIGNTADFKGVAYSVYEFLTNAVIVCAPIFGFVMPAVLAISLVVHSVKDKKFNVLPLIVILINIAHTVLLYSLIEHWF